MENTVNFQQGMDIDPDDFNNLQSYAKQTFDDLTGDAISPYQRYAGFNVTKTSLTAVLVDIGRLYSSGRIYAQTNQTAQDFVTHLPNVSQIVVSVVVTGSEVDTNVTPREFLINADTGASQPQAVALTHERLASVAFVYGTENPNAQPAVLPSGVTKIADILLTTSGVSTITMNPAAALPNLDAVQTRTSALELWRSQVDPQISTITSQVAGITSSLGKITDPTLIRAVAGDVARIKVKLKLPQNYVNYRAIDFYDATYGNAAASGFSATLAEGLRFPNAAQSITQASLLNPYNALVKMSTGGLVLPAYTEYVQRIVAGGVGYTALNQYAYQTGIGVVQSVASQRVRYGTPFEVSSGSSFYLAASVIGGGSGSSKYGAANVLVSGGATYQVTQTGSVDATGARILRLQQFWTDTTGSHYWNVNATPQNMNGYAWFETFVQANDAWLTALSARVYASPNDGSLLYVGICKCVNGVPDPTQMLCVSSAASSYWTPQGGLGSNKLPVTPTFLKGGERYAYMLMTQGAYSVQTVQTGTSPTTGTCFYGLNGGIWNPNVAFHLMFDAWYAFFTNNQTVVDLTPLSLAGGIGSIDITAGTVLPSSCSLTYQIQVNGNWQVLQSTSTSYLSTLPPLVPLQAVFTGTSSAQPGLMLTGSQVIAARTATSENFTSIPATLLTPSKTFNVQFDATNFNSTIHSVNVTMLTGTNFSTVTTPASITSSVNGNVTSFVATFSLSSTVSTYEVNITGTTTDATQVFVISNEVEVAS